MAKKKRSKSGSADTSRQHELVKLVRAKAQRWLGDPGVTSVGVGYKLDDDGKPTDEICIQFTVEEKLSLEDLAAEGIDPLPEEILDADGNTVDVQVIQRTYAPSALLLEDPPPSAKVLERQAAVENHAARRSRLTNVSPGISVSHPNGTAGTFGAVVYDDESGQPYMLSNWHVLHGNAGSLGDTIVQPGPYDGGRLGPDNAGQLVRSHVGLAGDCAVASIEGRSFDEEPIELDTAPRRIAKAELGDRVIKSGRTTGVTRGIVTRIGMVAALDYRQPTGVVQVGGFEIRPAGDDPAPRPDGEISKGGDSGSLWLVADDDWNATDVAVGLHFAGETNPHPSAEHAVACNIHSVFDKMGVSFEEKDEVLMDDEELWNRILAILALFGGRLGRLEREMTHAPGARVTAAPAEKCTCHGVGGPGVRGGAAVSGSEGLSIPVYGNWCGPGHGSGTPVDDVDRACMVHDQCYGREGYFDCGCNAQLLRDLDRALGSGNVRPLGRALGPAIRAWFTAQPCVHRIGGIPIPGGTGGSTHAVDASVTVVKSVTRGATRAWKTIKGWF